MTAALTIAVLLAAPAPAPAEDAAPKAEASPKSALDHLGEAQALRGEGRLEEAQAAASEALAADPHLAVAYLTRGEILAELARQTAAPDPALLEAAADDLNAYLARGELDPDTVEHVEEQARALRSEAAQLRSAQADSAEPDPDPVVAPAPVARPGPPSPAAATVDRTNRPLTGPALVGVGAALAVTGVGLSVAGLVVERRCTDLCSVSWGTRPAFLAPAITAALIGGAATTAGALLIARRQPSQKRRRALGGALVGLAAATVTAATITTAIAAAQWDRLDPSDDPALASTQRLANASLALFAAVPTLAGAGVATLVARPRVEVRAAGAGLRGRF